MHYRRPLLQLPPICDGCGAQFSISHALDSRKGGLVLQRHNEIRDVICDLATLTWNQITKDPVVRDISENPVGNALDADLGVRGVWQPQSVALFDVCVIHTDTHHIIVVPLNLYWQLLKMT